jgi:hypothetical protein
MADWRADGVTTLNDGMFFSQRDRIVALAKHYRLPSVHPEAEFRCDAYQDERAKKGNAK